MKRLCLIFCHILGLSLQAQTTAPGKAEAVSQAAIQSAFQILRSEYIRSNELTFDELNRAALQGLLERLDLGAELISKLKAEPPVIPSGVLSEKLTPEIAYLRPLAFLANEVTELETRLREHREAHIPYLILDLRNAAPPGDFSVAAALLECFVPEGELLFKLKQVGRDDAQLFISHKTPVWPSNLVVLVDAETNNLGETVAAVLHQRKQAFIIGSSTRGATVRHETLPLDEHWLLRFARAEMLLADDTSLYKKGLRPDFPIQLEEVAKRRLFVSGEQRPALKDTLFDQARLRYNEAALVSGKNPELDDYIRRSSGEPAVDPIPALRDTVLQRAVDMLVTRTHLEAMNLDWKAGPREARPTIKKAKRAP